MGKGTAEINNILDTFFGWWKGWVYNAPVADEYIKLVFGIENKEDNQKGYHSWIVYKNSKLIYQFRYVEDMSIYDDVRAFDIINSNITYNIMNLIFISSELSIENR